jgi:hypothetical protein
MHHQGAQRVDRFVLVLIQPPAREGITTVRDGMDRAVRVPAKLFTLKEPLYENGDRHHQAVQA